MEFGIGRRRIDRAVIDTHFPFQSSAHLAGQARAVVHLPVAGHGKCLVAVTSRQQQTQRTLLDWLRVEYGIARPSNKLLALTDLDSNTWVSEAKRIRGKKQPRTAAGLHALRDEYTRTIEAARALAPETLTLERTLSDLVNQAYGLTPAEIALMWQTAPPRMPIPPPAT